MFACYLCVVLLATLWYVFVVNVVLNVVNVLTLSLQKVPQRHLLRFKTKLGDLTA
jgi:hypothetical protein